MVRLKIPGLPDLKSAADSRRVPYSRDNPSPRYLQLGEMYASMHQDGRPETDHSAKKTFAGGSLAPHIDAIARLVAETGARSLLDYGSGKGLLYQDAADQPGTRYKTLAAWKDVRVTCYDPGYAPYAAPVDGVFDAVISTDVVEHIPEDDIPWLLDELFGYANKFVYVVAACSPANKIMPDGTNAHCTVRRPQWWAEQMRSASLRRPEPKWVLCTQKKSYFAFEKRRRIHKRGMRTRFFHSHAARAVD